MTTVNTVGIHHCVIVTTEMHRYAVNIDNAVYHGSAKNRVHFGVMYTTGYGMCCKGRRWHALEFDNG